jgi:hypothetical protein
VGVVHARLLEGGHAAVRPLQQLVERPELDRVGGARLCAGRLEPVLEPVVAEGALVHAAVAADLPLGDHAERARRDAVAAAVADVVLDQDGPELGPHDRAGRADVEAAGVRAVLADVGRHQPPQAVGAVPHALFDEGDVTPAVRVQLAGVVVRVAGPDEPVVGHEVPLLAGDLAGLAADADRRVGEEPDAGLDLEPVGRVAVGGSHSARPG